MEQMMMPLPAVSRITSISIFLPALDGLLHEHLVGRGELETLGTISRRPAMS